MHGLDSAGELQCTYTSASVTNYSEIPGYRLNNHSTNDSLRTFASGICNNLLALSKMLVSPA